MTAVNLDGRRESPGTADADTTTWAPDLKLEYAMITLGVLLILGALVWGFASLQ